MAKDVLVLSHEVKNFEEWKSAFDSDAARREATGFNIIGLYRGHDNANMVTLIAEVADIEAAKGMFNDPSLKEMMAQSGVISEPQATFLVGVE